MAEEAVIRRVGVVLFDGFTVLDPYGPIQAFGSCLQNEPDGKRFCMYQMFTLGMQTGLVQSSQETATQVDYCFEDAPPRDILLVPGGPGTRKLVNDEAFINSLKQASERSTITATVCTGAALLARTGLLDRRPATSNKMAWDWVIQQGPLVDWQKEPRWVDDGTIITSGGVAAGMDMTLALIARLNGHQTAVMAARFMEYVWNQDPHHDPFA